MLTPLPSRRATQRRAGFSHEALLVATSCKLGMALRGGRYGQRKEALVLLPGGVQPLRQKEIDAFLRGLRRGRGRGGAVRYFRPQGSERYWM